MNEEKNIPKHWKIVELKDVVSILGDGLHGTPRYSDVGDYFFINGNNLCDGKIIIKENTKRVSVEEYNKYKKVLNENTILVSINGTLGNVAFYNNEKVILGKSACYFNVTEAIDKNYLKILISGKQFLNYANNEATGSTIKNVSLKAMREFSIPLPPLSEQQAIVSKIEELLSDLENGKQQLLLAQQQLKIYRQSLLKWAFEGKLTNKNVKDGELPKGWKNVSVDKIGKVKGGKRLPKGNAYSDEPTKYPYLRVTDFENQTINQSKLKFLTVSTQTQIKNYIISKNDVFISIAGTIGVTGTIPENLDGANLTENAAKITDLKDVYNKYLSKFLSSMGGQSQIKEYTKTTTQPKLSLFRIEKIELPLPSLSEQQLIVDELESKLTVCDKIEETISQSLQQAETLKQSILKKAFEGKLV